MKFNIQNFQSLFLLSLNFTISLIILYSLNKGIDTSDESFYFLFTNQNQEVNNYIFNFDILFKFIHSIFNFDIGIWHLRLIRFCGTILGVLFLAKTLKKHFNLDAIHPFLYYNFCVFFVFSSYCIFPHTLSYNTINLITSLFLLSFSIKLIEDPKKYLYAFLLTLCLFIIYLTKISSFVLFYGIINLIIIYYYLTTKKYNYLVILGLISAIFLIAYLAISISYPSISITNIQKTIQRFQGGYYSPFNLLLNLNASIVALGYSLLLGYISNLTSNQFNFSSILRNLSILILVGHLYLIDLHTHLESYRISYLVFFMLGYSLEKIFFLNKSQLVIVFLLFVFPFSLFYGTDSSIGFNIQLNLVFILIIVLLINTKKILNLPFLILIIIFISKGFWNNTVSKPYLQKNLMLQTNSILINKSIHYVDVKTKFRLEKIQSFYLKAPTNPIYAISMFQNIGDVSLTGKVFPYAPFWDYQQFIMWIKLNHNLPNEFFAIIYKNEIPNLEYFKNHNKLLLGAFECEDNFGKKRILCCYYLYK